MPVGRARRGRSVAHGRSHGAHAGCARAGSTRLHLFAASPGDNVRPVQGALALGILILAAEDVDIPWVDLYTSARTAVEANTALRVAPLDLFSESVRQDAIKHCAGEGRCFLEKFRASGVRIDLLLTISAARLDERLLLGLRLADARRAGGEEIAAKGVAVDKGASIEARLREELASVLGPEIWGQVGAIAVDADTGAEVRVEDQVCVAPCRIERIPPRAYAIEISKRGFGTWRGRTDVEPGRTAVVRARLVALPVEAPEIWERGWFWAAVGGAALVIGTGAVLALRHGPSGSDTVCIGGRGQCP